MSNDIAIPDYLKDMMAEGVVENTTAQMDVATGGVPRLSTKGKVFRFREGEDEEKAGQEILVIIVGMSPERGLAHTFYKDGYSPDASDPPDCSSANGVEPDNWINEPVSKLCAKCPNQVWGSAKSMSGGKAKACKDSKHLYVARAKDFKENAKECKLWLMSVTVNSLKAFSNYGKLLSSKGIPGPQFALTKIKFDEEASVPKLEFELMGMLGKDHGITANERSKAGEWKITPVAMPQKESNKALPETPQESPDPDADVGDLLEQW